MNLPEWYKKWISRVSEVVSFIFPFKGEDKQRYLDWLADAVPDKRKRGFAINEDEYLKEAQYVWTFIHAQMENYMTWNRGQDRRRKIYLTHNDTIMKWLDYIDKLKEDYPSAKWLPEQVVRDKDERFQWTIDVVRVDEESKTVYLYDYKTWGIAKKRYKLPNTYKKPYWKLKKVSLQLSLYAEIYRQKGYKIWGIYAVWLHESWTYEYKLDLYSTKEIDRILAEYKLSKIPEAKIIINNNDMFEIEILEPTKQYGNVKIRADLSKIDNWKTVTQNIDDLVKIAKYSANKMK